MTELVNVVGLGPIGSDYLMGSSPFNRINPFEGNMLYITLIYI